jgi:hypothetical protein
MLKCILFLGPVYRACQRSAQFHTFRDYGEIVLPYHHPGHRRTVHVSSIRSCLPKSTAGEGPMPSEKDTPTNTNTNTTQKNKYDRNSKKKRKLWVIIQNHQNNCSIRLDK